MDGGSSKGHPVLDDPRYRSARRGETWAVFLAILLAFALFHLVISRLIWSEIPLQTDTGIWAYFAARMLEGATLYLDLWESKPPGIFWTFSAAEWLFGVGSDWALVWLDALVTVAVCGMTYLAARRVAGAGMALFAVCLLSVVMSHRVLADWGDNLEKFVVFFEMTASWLVVGSARARSASLRWLFAGLCCGLAAVFKQTGILLLVILVAGLAFDWRALGGPRRGRASVLLLAGAAVPWVVVLGWLVSNGTMGGFWRQVIVHDVQRAASPELERARLLEPEHWAGVGRHLLLAGVLLGPALAALILRAGEKARSAAAAKAPRQSALPAIDVYFVYAILATLVFVLAPHGYGHYLLHAAPPAAVLLAWLASSRPSFSERPIVCAICLAGMLIGLWQLGDHFEFLLQPRCDARRAYKAIRERNDRLVDVVRDASTRDQSVLLWPADHAVNYYARRRTPLEMCQAIDIFRGRVRLLDPPLDVVVQRLMEDPPDVIVDWSPVAVERRVPGDPASPPELLTPAGGYSLAEDPNPNHAHVEGRLLAPLKSWLRKNYGAQSRVDDLCTVYYRGKPWRDWREYLLPPARARTPGPRPRSP